MKNLLHFAATPFRIAGRICTIIVLAQLAFGGLAYSGHLPGRFTWSFEAGNLTPQETLSQHAANEAIQIAALTAEAAQPVPPKKPKQVKP